MTLRQCGLSLLFCLASTPLWAWNAEDLKPLYAELVEFKDATTFANLGFAPASPHHDWLDRVGVFSDDNKSDQQFFFAHGVVAGDLLMLGQEYRSSKGAETDYSRYMRKKMDAAFGL